MEPTDRLVIFLGNSFRLDLGTGEIALRPLSLRSLAENSEYAIGTSPDSCQPAGSPDPSQSAHNHGRCNLLWTLDYWHWRPSTLLPLGVQIGPTNAAAIRGLNEGKFHEYKDLVVTATGRLCDRCWRTTYSVKIAWITTMIPQSRPMTLDGVRSNALGWPVSWYCLSYVWCGHCKLIYDLLEDSSTFSEMTSAGDYFYYEQADAQVLIPYDIDETMAEEESYTSCCEPRTGWQSSTWSGVVHKMSVAIPALTMLTGGSESFPMEFASSSAVDLSASIQVPPCIESARFNYQWTIVSGPTNPPLDERTQTKLTLHVPRLTFEPGHDYSLSLHAEVDGSPEQSNTAMAYIRVLFSDLVAMISGESYCSCCGAPRD